MPHCLIALFRQPRLREVRRRRKRLRQLVAFLAASVVDIAIVFVAFADGSLLPVEAPTAQSVAPIPPKTQEIKQSKPTRKKSRRHITDAQLINFIQENPGANNAQVARQFGVTRQAISERRKHLTPH